MRDDSLGLTHSIPLLGIPRFPILHYEIKVAHVFLHSKHFCCANAKFLQQINKFAECTIAIHAITDCLLLNVLFDSLIDIWHHDQLLVGAVSNLHKSNRNWNTVGGDKPENILHDESHVDNTVYAIRCRNVTCLIYCSV